MSFNPERLSTARIYRNMTVSDLAEKTDVTKQAISQYERGQSVPKVEMLFKLILALGFPKDFFEQENKQSVKVANTFFRALASTKKLDLQTQEIKSSMVIQIYNFLDTYLTLPELKIPDVDGKQFDNIEQVADYVRSYWSLGDQPIENMVNLLESKGIIVSSFFVENMKIDAFTQVVINADTQQAQYCVVLGSDKQSMVRRNFDAAHELGHIILHRDIENIDQYSKEEVKNLEDQANMFAASFLLPKQTFFLDLILPTKLEAYIQLKKKWRVSIAAMIMRARQIGRLTNNQYQYLFKQLAFKGWRTCEPFDDIWEVPRPLLFKKAVTILSENNVLNKQQIISNLAASGLPLSAIHIEKLLDLDHGTLNDVESDQPAVVLSIKPKRA